MHLRGMDSVTIATAQHVDITYEAAGAGDRAIASIIDVLLQWSVLFILSFGLVLGQATAAWIYFSVLALVTLYHPICETLLDGQSIGKRVMNTRVVRTDGSRAGVGSFIIRWLFSLVEIWMTGGLMALVAMLVNRRGQRIGDMAAGTAVVRLRDDVKLGETGFMRAGALPATPSIPEVAALTPTDAQTLHAVLQQARSTGRNARTEHLLHRAKEVTELKLGIPPSDEQPYRFLVRILADYNTAR